MNHPLTSVDILLAQTWKLVKSEWKVTLKWTLGSIAFGYAIQLLNLILAGQDFARTFYVDERVLTAGIFGLVALVGSLYFHVGLIRHLSLKAMPHLKPPTMGRLLIMILAVSVMVLPLVIGGFILFIIPGIWLLVALSFVFMELLDGKGVVSSISASFQLVKGRWWAVFGRNLMAGLIVLAVSMAVGFLLLGFALVFLFVGVGSFLVSGLQFDSFVASILAHPGQSVGFIVAAVAASLIVLAISIAHRVFILNFAASYHVLLYKALKETPPPPPTSA